jgi:spectrin beta
MGWVTEKMQVALDESYRDPTNLQGKIQKHQAYEAELTANRKRIDVVSAVCSNSLLLCMLNVRI